MLSKKSFWGNKRNFLKLLMRFVRSDVRDHIVSQKTTTDLRIGTTEHRSGGVVQKSPFARFLASFDFRLFRQHRSEADIPEGLRDVPYSPRSGHHNARSAGPPRAIRRHSQGQT